MKKKFKDTKFAKIAGSILKGAFVDTLIPFGGVASGALIGLNEGIKKVKESNLKDTLGGSGKVNYVRLFSLLVFVTLIALFIFGVIDKETLEYLVELFEDRPQ